MVSFCVSIHGCSSHAHLYSLFISFLLGCIVFIAVLELSQVAASRALPHRVWASPCSGLSVRAQASGARALIVAAQGLACSHGMRIFPDPRSNPRPLHAQASSYPWTTERSPLLSLYILRRSVSYTLSTHFAFLLNDLS